ncbi:hypothetical protein [Stutzerimonas stutzeri]|uniref:hypothetical protein n=1 Tax=Stutzerimonas stutzeri TaxID=316 RepID=UPI003C6F67FA
MICRCLHFVPVLWLWQVNGFRPTTWDIVGALVVLSGMAIIMFLPGHHPFLKSPARLLHPCRPLSTIVWPAV